MENRPDPPTPLEPDWEALARYAADESDPAEAETVRSWLAHDPGSAALVSRLRGSAPAAEVDVEGALRRVHARMGEDGEEGEDLGADPRVVPLHPGRTPRPALPGWLRLAAGLVLLLGGAFLLLQLAGYAGTARTRSYATAVGQRDSLRLPDGTRVLLGPDSRLTLSRGYGRGERSLELAGEALFDVTHDAARPFTVRAGGAWVRDLGTTFTVHADRGSVRVVVTAGAVAVRPLAAEDATPVVLRRGDRATLPAGGQVQAERAAASDEDLAWTRGRLVFRDAPLAEVASDLRRWYGVELRAADAVVAGRRLTAAFGDEPPRRVLEVIALALGAELTVHGDTAVLRAPGR